ncbi:MAG: hypothetical protein K0M40_11570 [Prolixibacteraceae bacterium]|nr:hypothetical protein [Prolixibacteraceae bacterium]
MADEGMSTWITTNLYWAYVLLGIATIAALVLEFVNTISDKKATKSALVALGFSVAVIGISYLLANDEMPKFFGANKFIEDGTITPSSMRWIGTGLIATYILSAISVIAIVWSSITSIFK